MPTKKKSATGDAGAAARRRARKWNAEQPSTWPDMREKPTPPWRDDEDTEAFRDVLKAQLLSLSDDKRARLDDEERELLERLENGTDDYAQSVYEKTAESIVEDPEARARIARAMLATFGARVTVQRYDRRGRRNGRVEVVQRHQDGPVETIDMQLVEARCAERGVSLDDVRERYAKYLEAEHPELHAAVMKKAEQRGVVR